MRDLFGRDHVDETPSSTITESVSLFAFAAESIAIETGRNVRQVRLEIEFGTPKDPFTAAKPQKEQVNAGPCLFAGRPRGLPKEPRASTVKSMPAEGDRHPRHGTRPREPVREMRRHVWPHR